MLLSACGFGQLALSAAANSAESDIIGGQPESGYPAVGALVSQGESFCTGTLVTPTVVVTAAHCLQGETASNISYFIGQNANNAGAGVSIPGVELAIHPDFSWDSEDNDVGVLRLASAATVAPVPWLNQPMTNDFVGRSALFVGYGVTSVNAQSAGVKYSVSIPIEQVMPTSFRCADPDHNTCWGDSGGPALIEENGVMTLIGVVSWGDEYCAEFGVNMRVDAYADFIQGFIDGTLPDSTGDPAADFCEQQGWYGDGYCDQDCPQPDPDCGGGGVGDPADYCEQMGWYGDGYCDADCPQPDPDCDGSDVDLCEQQGLYGDGSCDAECPQPDPDCDVVDPDDGGGDTGSDDDDVLGPPSEDLCEVEGWYGDGVCDPDCLQPDPDCGSDTGTDLPGGSAPGDGEEQDANQGAAEQASVEADAVEADAEQGCGCRASGGGAGSAPSALLLAVGLLIHRRRRRGV